MAVNTAFLLMAQFERAFVPLEEIAMPILGLSSAQAKRRAAHNEFLFPVFREGQKWPWLVRVTDIAAWIDKSAEDARRRIAA